jgi:hypothetical protein
MFATPFLIFSTSKRSFQIYLTWYWLVRLCHLYQYDYILNFWLWDLGSQGRKYNDDSLLGCNTVLSRSIPTFQTRALLPLSDPSLWRWRQYEPLKRRYTSTRLQGGIYKKAATFIFSIFSLKRKECCEVTILSVCVCLPLITFEPTGRFL